MLKELEVQECDATEPNQGIEVRLIKNFHQVSKI